MANDESKKKRKRIEGEKLNIKKKKSKPASSLNLSSSQEKGVTAKQPPSKIPKNPATKPKFQKKDTVKNIPKTKRELRLKAKELAKARKKKRKPHYTLEQELVLLWEKMRRRNIGKEDKSCLVSEALRKMKGKIPEIAVSHIACRVLQTCVKYCSQDERNAVFEEIRPHLLDLARNTYAAYLLTKILDNASKEQLAEIISSLHGRVASLLRHMVGSLVVEHAYQLGNATQKQALLMELYSTELRLFKDLVSIKESRLLDILSKLQLNKASVSRHMSSVLQPILEKGIVDHSIIHRALVEYLTIAEESTAAEIIQQLSGELLVRMIHTKDGSKIAIFCIKHGSAKERKKIIKGMKDKVIKAACDRFGSMVLTCILSNVDDTKLLQKLVIRELQEALKDLILDKNGRRPLLQLLHPNCPRYLSPDDLSLLDSSIPSLHMKGRLGISSDPSKQPKSSIQADEDMTDTDAIVTYENTNSDENIQSMEGGKKDPLVRRRELLVNSGLAESLIDACCESVEELLKSNHGKEVLYEIARGGEDRILCPHLDEKLKYLHEVIASTVALPKSKQQEEEHLLENFHSSRAIRKLVLDCPAFASTLWEIALKGNCEMWAQGHSSKVLCAFLESSDPLVCGLAREELQPLVDRGLLKLQETKQ